MNELSKVNTITSLELLEEINIFRKIEGNTELQHDSLFDAIWDEFKEEILLRIIVPSEYKDGGRKCHMFTLKYPQVKRVLKTYSEFVSESIALKLDKIEELDFLINQLSFKKLGVK